MHIVKSHPQSRERTGAQGMTDYNDGTGEVEVTLDEPDGDYEYERRRDAQMEAAK